MPVADSLPVVRLHCEVAVAANGGMRCDLCANSSALGALLRDLGAALPSDLVLGGDDDVLVVVPADGLGVSALSLATEEGVDVLTFVAGPPARAGRFAQFVVLPRRDCQLAIVWRHAEPELGEQTLRVFARDALR